MGRKVFVSYKYSDAQVLDLDIYEQNWLGATSKITFLDNNARVVFDGSDQKETGIEAKGEKLNFLVIEIDITKETTLYTIIKKIELALKRQLAKSEPTRKLFSDIWKFIGKVEVAGVKVNTSTDYDKELFF